MLGMREVSSNMREAVFLLDEIPLYGVYRQATQVQSNQNHTKMKLSIEERIPIYLKRKANGSFCFPRCAKAHAEEIKKYYPHLAAEKELNKL